MKKVEVYYQGWGEDWRLGVLADNGRQLLFEYSPEALQRGLELSPIRLKLRREAYGDFPSELMRLPGLIADALPDGYGLLVQDRSFRKHGFDPAAVSPLDRLVVLGSRAMGALTFRPEGALEPTSQDSTLLTLAEASHVVYEGGDGEALKVIAQLGGSPHGARPKVLVYLDSAGTVRTEPAPAFVPWLVKFQMPSENPEVCALEALWADLARACGIELPETRYFELGPRFAAFGVVRFDREAGLRVPIHTLAGALHADFRAPGSVDYATYLRAVRAFTRSEREVAKAFERAVFNVVFHNRDDHPKNHAFRLNRRGEWQLAPAYDLTFSSGPGGEHFMDVAGEGRAITREQLLALAKSGGLDARTAASIIERTTGVAGELALRAADYPIRRDTLATVVKAVQANCGRMTAGEPKKRANPKARPEGVP